MPDGVRIMKALLIEDNALTRNTMKALLARLGHEVVAEAENGLKAVSYFTEFKPDVVFLDLILPGKSGLDVLDELYSLDPQVSVIVVTAVDQDEMDRRLLEKNVKAILRKPFTFDEFKAAMEGLSPEAAEKNRTLEGIAAAGMERCLERLSRISYGKWSVAGIRVTRGSMDEVVGAHNITGISGFAVYFTVTGECPFTSIIMFKLEDVGIISRGFLGSTKLPDLGQAREFLFAELGNIILNSVISALSNKLKRGFLPSAPKSVQGETRFLLEALWDTLDEGQRYSAASITIDLRCGEETARSEVVVVIPESLDRALAAA